MANVLPCPKRDDLQQFLLGRLPEMDALRLQGHLADCPSCLDTLHGLEARDTLVDAMRAQQQPVARAEDVVVEDLVAQLSGLGPPVPCPAAETTVDRLPATPRPIQPEDCSFLAPAEAPDEIGRLGGYRVLKILGGGDMGIVLEAEDPRLKRRVALKVMKPDLATNEVARKRFLREAQAVAALEHDHIIAIHEVDEDRDVPFLAMPLLRGESLEDRLVREESGVRSQESEVGSRRLAIEETVRIGREIAEGLAAAHAAGLTHRDIKPANVWLEQAAGPKAQGQPSLGFPRVKIVDFGLARPAEDDLHLTASGTIAGTPSYMAPEQAEGKPVDHRSDLFSLGAVLYRMATGELPFKGSSAITVLRALAVEQPAPPRTLNRETPAELSDLILRLLAKNPDERPASARQVADELARIERCFPARPSRPPRRRLRVALFAAASLLLVAAGTVAYFGPAAVYRFTTNQGQLTIESDDPDVEITVKRAGKEVAIVDKKTGHQLTLTADDYELVIAKGQADLKLKTNQFTLSRGGAVIVLARIDREAAELGQTPPEKSPPPPEKIPILPPATPFVILARDGRKETKHVGLAEAVAAAQSGDTIEIRGNGPFDCPPLQVKGKALVVRAAAGTTPVLQFGPKGIGPQDVSWQSDAPLTLEGLDLRRLNVEEGQPGSRFFVFSLQSRLHVTSCRFIVTGKTRIAALGSHATLHGEVRNCLFAGALQAAVQFSATKPSHVLVDNCVLASGHGVVFSDLPGSTLRLTRNTLMTWSPVAVFPRSPKPGDAAELKTETPMRIESVGNVVDAHGALSVHVTDEQVTQPADGEALVRRCISWHEQRNIYRPTLTWLAVQLPNRVSQPAENLKTVKDWQQFWGAGGSVSSSQGDIRFEGADLQKRAAETPETVAAADFRLGPKSAGKGAGENGHDLGADVDTVGPGKAYEAWKKSPAYEPWLAATGQSTPFVVLTPGAKSEQKFSGLADAVTAAKSGDTIEIRGNGPYETPAINTGKALVLRAGAGFEPVLQPDLTSVGLNAQLLYSWGPLVLEGLHFRHVEDLPRDKGYTVIGSWHAPISVTHCRFFLKASRHINALSIGRSPRTEVRHCEFAGNHTIAINWSGLASFHRLEVSDSLNWGASNFVVTYHHPPEVARDIAVRLERNTCVGHGALQHYYTKLDAAATADQRPFHIEARDNVFDTYFLLGMTVPAPQPFQPEVDRLLLPRCFTWNESKNVYTGNLLHFYHNAPPKPSNVEAIKQLKEWRGYWGLGDTGSVQGRLRYEGENVRAKRASAPEKLTAADFRLHRDSDGKGVGAGGRDLGVDVDKVGPGKAYEAWKGTPAYTRWRDATGQVLDPEPFVLIDPARKKEYKYAKLATAIDLAQSGDIIEIRGNGPFVTPTLKIGDKKALVIRAGAGFEPVLQLDAKSLEANAPLIDTHGPLVLEGLHIRHIEDAALKAPNYTLIYCNNAPFAVTHCRFFIKSKRNLNTLLSDGGPRVHVSHCEFAGVANNAVTWSVPAVGELDATDNLCWGTNSLVFFAQHSLVAPQAIAVRLRRNTFLGNVAVLQHYRDLPEPPADPSQKPYRIDAAENVFDANVFSSVFTGPGAFDPESLRPLLPRAVAWNESKNVYRNSGLLHLGQYAGKSFEAIKDREAWESYWSLKDTGSLHQGPRYQGGGVGATKTSAPEKLAAGDFRLHPESPGKGTGANGRDPGADVELVGPGAAYEYWKRTPQYQEWLKATGQ